MLDFSELLPGQETSSRCFNPQRHRFSNIHLLHWGRYAKIELSDNAKLLALDLLTRYDNHISSTLLFDKICEYRFSQPTQNLFTGVHCASYFGIDEILPALIEAPGYDINQGDC